MNYIMWIIIGGIVILMAIIGYLAENKNKEAQKNSAKKGSKIPEVNVETIETKEGAATWSKNAKPKDERQETEHKVPSVDDWSKIPDTPDKKIETEPIISEDKKENQEVMFENLNNNKSEIKEVSTTTAPTPVPTPVENVPTAPVPMPAEKEVPAPVPVASEKSPLPAGTNNTVANSNQQETQAEKEITQVETPKEQITEPISTENIWN